MAWKKGESGNLKGRPKELKEVQLLARKYTNEAVNRLVHWMQSDNAKASVAASNAILDRAWGKPDQNLELNDKRHITVIIEQYPDERDKITSAPQTIDGVYQLSN